MAFSFLQRAHDLQQPFLTFYAVSAIRILIFLLFSCSLYALPAFRPSALDNGESNLEEVESQALSNDSNTKYAGLENVIFLIKVDTKLFRFRLN